MKPKITILNQARGQRGDTDIGIIAHKVHKYLSKTLRKCKMKGSPIGILKDFPFPGKSVKPREGKWPSYKRYVLRISGNWEDLEDFARKLKNYILAQGFTCCWTMDTSKGNKFEIIVDGYENHT